MKTRPSLRRIIREKVAQNLRAFVEQVRDELVEFESRAVAAGYLGIVVIYDSLEKLRSSSLNYDEVLNSCERVFSQGASHLKLPVHVVYTVPPALLSRMRGESVHFFPMIKLRTKRGEQFEPGMEAAREIVAARLSDDVLEEQLGPDWGERRDRMLLWSGGFPREIVRMLQRIIEQDGPLSVDQFERLLSQVSDEYQDLVQRSQYEWLAELAVTKHLAIDNDAQSRAERRIACCRPTRSCAT